VTQLILGDLRTGHKRQTFPDDTLAWSLTRNSAGTIRASTPISSRLVQKLDLRNATEPVKSYLGVVENDIPLEVGPIWRRVYRKATGTLELTAGGLWSYFDHRLVMPLLADTDNVIDPVTGASTVASGTDLTLMSYGTMAKRLIAQSLLWTGGNLPIVFQADEVGTYEQHYLGASLSKIGDMLRDLVGLVKGVDIRFQPQWTPDRLGIQWALQTGTLAAPELHSATTFTWDYSVQKRSIKDLVDEADGSGMTGQAWTSGGRQSGVQVVQRAIDPFLVGLGYPLLESVDSSHADASLVDTLMQYSQNAVMLGRAPSNAWSFTVKADESPHVGEYLPGDFVKVKMRKDPWIDDGDHVREIASMSGDQDGKWVSITAEETIDA